MRILSSFCSETKTSWSAELLNCWITELLHCWATTLLSHSLPTVFYLEARKENISQHIHGTRVKTIKKDSYRIKFWKCNINLSNPILRPSTFIASTRASKDVDLHHSGKEARCYLLVYATKTFGTDERLLLFNYRPQNKPLMMCLWYFYALS